VVQQLGLRLKKTHLHKRPGHKALRVGRKQQRRGALEIRAFFQSQLVQQMSIAVRRGSMAAIQHQDYVLLFVKYVNDKYAGQHYPPINTPCGSQLRGHDGFEGDYLFTQKPRKPPFTRFKKIDIFILIFFSLIYKFFNLLN
jgi:hypothetical protein